MRKIFYALSIALTSAIILAGAVLGFSYLYPRYEKQKAQEENKVIQYEIAISDQVDIYFGDQNILHPYLISDAGTVEKSRFDYVTNSELVEISYDGKVTLSGVPDQPVSVTITERNTGTSKTIVINVCDKLEKVLGIIAPDGNLVLGAQSLQMGNVYPITVITEPINTLKKELCTVVTVDQDGQEKHVFDLDYEKDKILLKVVGLGKGKLNLAVKNHLGEQIFTTGFDFEITAEDVALGNKILASQGKELLSSDELSQIKSIEIDEEITNLSPLEMLSTLELVKLKIESITELENISDKYTYQIPVRLFEQVCASEQWQPFLECLTPYDNQNPDNRYVVYHNDKVSEFSPLVSYAIVSEYLSLSQYEFAGYIHQGWTDKLGNPVTDISSLTISEKGLHLYARWKEISYSVKYIVREGGNAEKEENWTFDAQKALLTAQDVCPSVTKVGYKFAGWTTNSASSTTSQNVKYLLGQEYTNLTTKPDDTVLLYDLWAPITYTITFVDEDLQPLSVTYDSSYVLTKTAKDGYTFKQWKQEGTENVYLAGTHSENLADQDGAEIRLKAEYDQIVYTVIFDFNGGVCPSFETGYQAEIAYEEVYSLPKLTKVGSTTYSWVCVESSKTYLSTDILYREFTVAKTVTLRATWTEAVYTINYDCNGGTIYTGSSYLSETSVNRYWNDGRSLATPTRKGYDFLGWRDLNPESNELYEKGGEKWTGNLISSASENNKIFNLKAEWDPKEYIISFDSKGGTQFEDRTIVFDSAYGELPKPEKEHYIFVDWYLNGWVVKSHTKFNAASNVTLEAEWQPVNYKMTISASHSSVTVQDANKNEIFYYDGNNIPYGTVVNIFCSADDGYENATCSPSGTYTVTGDFTITSSATKKSESSGGSGGGGCFVKGSLITLADGTQKAVENLTVGDEIMVFNHQTGSFDASVASFIFYDGYKEYEVLTLNFSNGQKVDVLFGHGFFDVELLKYVVITPDNVAQYVGHKFFYAQSTENQMNGQAVELVSYQLHDEYTECYSILSAVHVNHFVNGMLAVTDDIDGLFNIFELNEDMAYDFIKMASDIETYGLYSYEDWKDYVTYEQFIAFNGPYLKVAIGKGLITEAQILELISKFLV